MKRFCLGLSLVAVVALSTNAGAADDLHLSARWSVRAQANVIQLTLQRDTNDGPRTVESPFVVTPALGDPSSYELHVKHGGLDNVIPVTVSPAIDDDEDAGGRAGSVVFGIGDHSPNPEDEYELAIKDHVVNVVVDGASKSFPAATLPLDSKDLDRNLTFLRPMSTQSKIEVDGGTGGGVGQARLQYALNRLGGYNWLNLDLRGTADFNFQASNRAEYFNSLTAELKFFDAWLTTLGFLQDERYVEVDAHGRVESDQTVTNVDALGGVRGSIYTKDPISGFLSQLFVPKDPQSGLPTEAVTSPLITFACDYVGEVEEDPNVPGGGTKPDTSGGGARLDLGLYWSMPLWRDIQLRGGNVPPLLGSALGVLSTPFDGKVPDLDALFELHGWYDSAADEFLDQSRISLVFTRRSPGALKTSVAFTWARGQAPPTFDEINAFLAGLRLAF